MSNMALLNFSALLQDALQSRLGKNCSMEMRSVRKNNGTLIPCLVISMEQANQETFSHAVDINEYYTQFSESLMSMDEIIEDIVTLISQITMLGDLNQIKPFESFKDKIMFRLVNYEKNKETLSQKPHSQILDLAVEAMVVFDSITSTMSVTNELMQSWGISKEELFLCAKENTEKNARFVFKELFETLLGFMPEQDREKVVAEEQALLDREPMYILSNEEGTYGAVMMLRSDVLTYCAERLQSDLIILPSSIHEVLVVPSNSFWNMEELQRMVREVNQTEVASEEVLSDNIYKYNKQKKCLSMYSDGEENERFQIGDVFGTRTSQQNS